VWTSVDCQLERQAGAASTLTDDGNAVKRSEGADVVGGSDGTSNRRLLLLGAVLDALASEVSGTALACLQTNHQIVNICPGTATSVEQWEGGRGRRRT
jgi:hypothetical protein